MLMWQPGACDPGGTAATACPEQLLEHAGGNWSAPDFSGSQAAIVAVGRAQVCMAMHSHLEGFRLSSEYSMKPGIALRSLCLMRRSQSHAPSPRSKRAARMDTAMMTAKAPSPIPAAAAACAWDAEQMLHMHTAPCSSVQNSCRA